MSLNDNFKKMQQYFQSNRYPEAEERKKVLKKLQHALKDYRLPLQRAVSRDFGHRPVEETDFLELFPTLKALDYCQKNLKHWMKSQGRSVSWLFWPAKAHLFPQPVGVVGNMVPWNYPVYLALVPTAYAIAAGNRVMVKVSELTPETGEVLQKMLKAHHLTEWITVCTGDVEVSKNFASLPFGHLIFTGSTATGRHIMRAASENLTPVTLELGGKSPAIIAPDLDTHYLKRLFIGKQFNGAQTCIAPDYLFIAPSMENKLISAFTDFTKSCYPNYPENKQYSSIISQEHFDRLLHLIKDAQEKGARIVPLGEINHENRKFPLHLVFDVHDDMALMQEEIFGPILPIMFYEDIKQCIDYINNHSHPLALYYFGHRQEDINNIKKNTCSGALTINDTIMHIAIDALPFGGVGESGMGVYHGREGFNTFSKLKPIFKQRRIAGVTWLYPPYGRLLSTFLKWMGGFRHKEPSK